MGHLEICRWSLEVYYPFARILFVLLRGHVGAALKLCARLFAHDRWLLRGLLRRMVERELLFVAATCGVNFLLRVTATRTDKIYRCHLYHGSLRRYIYGSSTTHLGRHRSLLPDRWLAVLDLKISGRWNNLGLLHRLWVLMLALA